MNVYLNIAVRPAADIFEAGALAAVTIGTTVVTPPILDGWDDAMLATLGLVRATSEVPTYDATTTVLTGSYAAQQAADGSWQWVAQTRAMTAAELAAALASAKTARVADLTNKCAAAITGGFQSAALGAPHTYPSTLTDQTNLLGRVLQAQLNPSATFTFWCADANGVWAKREHTSAQMIEVGLDGAAAVQANTDKLSGVDGVSGLLGQANGGGDIAAVEAVTW